MRLTLALMTSAMLATAVSAQSIAPELQSRTPILAYAPPIAAPSPIASASVDKAELTPEIVVPPASPSLGLGADASSGALAATPGDEKLQSSRRSRASEAKRAYGRSEAQPAPSYRPVASGVRDFGRFWPPVF